MKFSSKLIILLVLSLVYLLKTGVAQTNNVGIGNDSQYPSAILELSSWEQGPQRPLDNSGSDEQNLSLTGDVLSLTNAPSSVDLSTYLDNTDEQNLSLIGNALNTTNGTRVDSSTLTSNLVAGDDIDIQPDERADIESELNYVTRIVLDTLGTFDKMLE